MLDLGWSWEASSAKYKVSLGLEQRPGKRETEGEEEVKDLSISNCLDVDKFTDLIAQDTKVCLPLGGSRRSKNKTGISFHSGH